MKRKISASQEHQLIQIFLHMGQQIVAPFCVECGVSAGYARNRAYELGLLPHRKASVITRADHRWAWAQERGSIIA